MLASPRIRACRTVGGEHEQDECAAFSVYYPEIVICLAAAVGTDTGVVSEAIASELRIVGASPFPFVSVR